MVGHLCKFCDFDHYSVDYANIQVLMAYMKILAHSRDIILREHEVRCIWNENDLNIHVNITIILHLIKVEKCS